MTNKKYIFFLIVAVFGVYFNSLPNEFIFDDIPLVKNSVNVIEMGFWDLVRSYRPLRYISYALDYRIFGMNPWGFRLMNIFYHSLTVLSVFWMLQVFGFTKRAAFFSALIFAIHPVNTDSVAYISGRRDVIMGLFYVLSIGMFMKFYNEIRQSRVKSEEKDNNSPSPSNPLNPLSQGDLNNNSPDTLLNNSPNPSFKKRGIRNALLPLFVKERVGESSSEGTNASLPLFVKERAGGELFCFLFLSLLFMFFSISSKEMGATIPLIYILYIFYKDGSKLFAKRWFYIVMMVFLLLFSFFSFMAISGGGSGLISLEGVHFHGNSPKVHYLTATTIWLHYLKQATLPFWLILDNANFPLILDWNFKVFFSILSMFIYVWVVWRLVSGGNNNSLNPSNPLNPLSQGDLNNNSSDTSNPLNPLSQGDLNNNSSNPLRRGKRSTGAFPLSASVKKRGIRDESLPLFVKERAGGELFNGGINLPCSTTTAFFLVFFVIALAPVLQIIPLHEIVAEHYLYVPIIGFCAVFGMWSDRLLCGKMDNNSPDTSNPLNPLSQGDLNNNSLNPSNPLNPLSQGDLNNNSLNPSLKKREVRRCIAPSLCEREGWGELFNGGINLPRLTATLTALILLFFSAQTIRRNFQLKNHWTVFHADERVAPLSFRGLFTLGAEYVNMRFPDKAWEYYQKAIDTGSWDGNLLSNIIGYHILKGNHNRAISFFEEMEKRGELITSNGVLNTAVLYMLRGKCERAIQLASSFNPDIIQRKRVEIVKNCKEHNFARFDNNSIEDIYEKQLLMKELGLEIERKPYLKWLLIAWKNSKSLKTSNPLNPLSQGDLNNNSLNPSLRASRSSWLENVSPLHIIRELAVVNLQSDIPEAIKYYKMERDLRQKMGKPVPEIVEQSIIALKHYKHQVLVEGKYLKLDW